MNRDLYFIHHSSYLYVSASSMLLFDYYGTSSIQDLIAQYPEKHLYIFSTHSHGDHYSKDVHTLFREHPAGVSYIFHEEVRHAVPQKYQDEVTYIDTGEEKSRDSLKVKAYGSTDLGGSFYIEDETFRIFHAGDLNNWHWNEEASLEYIQIYEEQWHKELAVLQRDGLSLDLLMFPTDLRLGKDYLKGLKELMAVVPCKNLAPMHLNGTLTDSSELESVCEKNSTRLLLPQPMTRRSL